ncbi:uncharacterized protein TRIADDRAFT_50976 [Trichoplax adhaerens]|uniref:AN1-type domain-containing protein n=1 Tax=Trichoplax adhaerens TaxID=10228 RepID=B3S9T7_TRIAD|nr:hypothetical protein TRIADDRAFT_50976 [Trichoplax adhaerens]EDV20529.1 hypothetical protein TRIADDRAFT_50976 [Trichoplax adhaerens]|eukprot:XP_002116955.1 hypothetical protein TRIADDRAFT_50976 [Trichoplax adhaerens]
MEFPQLGQNCSNPQCSRLDFLPVKCNACHKIFCNDHYLYTSHNCPLAYTKDVQVPVCPLCNQPVPVGKGESPDDKVSRHMDNDCKFEKPVKRSNRCSLKGCKMIELVPVVCPSCKKNFCLKHRHEQDHNCQPR